MVVLQELLVLEQIGSSRRLFENGQFRTEPLITLVPLTQKYGGSRGNRELQIQKQILRTMFFQNDR